MFSKDQIINVEQSTRQSPPIGLYIHIPYCRRRCRYCDFAIVPIGRLESSSSSSSSKHLDGFHQMDQIYRSAILKEIQEIQKQLQQKHPRQQPKCDDSFSTPSNKKILIQSIYFGGGTPSLAPIETISAILGASIGSKGDDDQAPFELVPNAEISIEMDPGTFSQSKLQSLKELGFNRISLGVQSFDDTLLEQIGRTHRQEDVRQALEMIHHVFGPTANFSLDLISGLPSLTLAKWAETLQIATSLTPRPSHLSIYDLQVEQGTVFGGWYDNDNDEKDEEEEEEDIIDARGGTTQTPATSKEQANRKKATLSRPPLPSQEHCAFMYKYAAGYLRSKDYEHYEVSSYAYRGYDQSLNATADYVGTGTLGISSRRSRHNQVYWNTDGQWYAVGLGATSSVDGVIVARPKALADYVEWVEVQRQQRSVVTTGDQEDTKQGQLAGEAKDYEKLTDVVMKRLRTSDGLDMHWVEDNFGQEAVQSILVGANLGLELGLAEISPSSTTQTGDVLRLADPDGLLYSNYIISSIFMELGVDDDDGI